MRTRFLVALTIASLVAPTGALFADAIPAVGQQQEETRGRGDDLERIKRWRTFLDRASRAFFAARMNTAAVQAKVDITGDVAFLERAQRAFTAARMNTAEVNKWLEEAREAAGG